MTYSLLTVSLLFQSTLPRGSDLIIGPHATITQISIHAPSRERPILTTFSPHSHNISIHAPSRERLILFLMNGFVTNFNPRSLAGATRYIDHKGDLQHHFNPRSLAGATFVFFGDCTGDRDFNPRSLAGATYFTAHFFYSKKISIHAPSRERLLHIAFAYTM